MARHCAFCGSSSGLTREHVLPDWLTAIGLDPEPSIHQSGPLNRLPHQWSAKPFTTTVTRRLTPRQLAEYQPLFDTAKKLRALLSELQDLTLEIIEADSPRQQQSPEQETRGPENVGEARLTCGHPPSQTPFAQVRPKREDVSTGITCKARSEAHWTAPIVRSG